MLFNSPVYLLFLPIVFLMYWTVFQRNVKWQNRLLLLAGYFFYGWWSWKFLGLLILSTLLDYGYGFGVASENRKKAKIFLWLSVLNNLGILAVFKYYDFFALQLKEALALMGVSAHPVLLQLALPVGISFYTFHGMSYVFDIYRKQQQPVRSFTEYAVFVCFFPLLVAGPIERATHLLPQIQQKRVFDYSRAVAGAKLILWGMFKKVVIADGIAPHADKIFAHYPDESGLTLLVGAIGFSFQIYGDFSGYSDIALGSSKLLGFEILSNFRFPYFSRNVAEFWKRWHISLSSWFRDYLYIPLGGSRIGSFRTVINTFIIFLVSGFWHGASWNFLAWGGIHAMGFLPLLLAGSQKKYAEEVVAADGNWPSWRTVLSMFLTFMFVTLAWVFFRAPDLGSALGYLSGMGKNWFSGNGLMLSGGKTMLLLIITMLAADWYFRRDERNLRSFGRWSNLIYLLMFILSMQQMFASDESSDFIYFQF